MDIIFGTKGRLVRGVNAIEDDADLSTGDANTVYDAFTTRALFAAEKWRSKNFLNLQENMAVLERQAQFVVSSGVVYKTSLEQQFGKWFIYHIDKVTNDAVYLASRNQ